MTECDDPLQCQCYAANTGLTFQPMRTTQLKLILERGNHFHRRDFLSFRNYLLRLPELGKGTHMFP
jgi:hypothetical protein